MLCEAILFSLLSITTAHLYRRVINGYPLLSGLRHPADVSLQMVDTKGRKSQHFCGGVVIHEYWVLTAAHCFPSGKPSVTTVLQTEGKYHHHVKEVVKFSCEGTAVDLALVRTWEEIHAVKAILPPPGYEPRGVCEVCGRGTTSTHGNIFPNKLQCADIPLVDRDSCQLALGPFKPLQEGTLCAGGGDADACVGDSGSSLICDRSGTPVVAAVVSFGLGCAINGVPGVYTDVTSYRNWVQGVLNGTWTSESCYVHELS